jgi:predicted aspartyl protease
MSLEPKAGKLSSNDFIGQGIYTLADGSQSYSQIFLIRSLRVGNVEVKNVRGVITKNNGSLLLGQSFLRRFKYWSIDNRREVLLLQR